MLDKTPLTLDELIERMLVESSGLELSTVGFICNSIRTLEYTIEKAFLALQHNGVVSKRWNDETTQLVYKYTPTEEIHSDHDFSPESD